jgi:hypothetical protein
MSNVRRRTPHTSSPIFCMSPVAALPRPPLVSVAVTLLVLDAIIGAMSVHALFWLLPANKGWILPFQPGVWILALLQVLLSLMILRGANWSRWLVGTAVLFMVGNSLLNTSISMRYQSYPAATTRDALGYVMQVSAVCLLFLPASAAWFRALRKNADA